MTRMKLVCDICKKEIAKREDIMKVMEFGKMLASSNREMKYKGDICKSCWEKFTNPAGRK